MGRIGTDRIWVVARPATKERHAVDKIIYLGAIVGISGAILMALIGFPVLLYTKDGKEWGFVPGSVVVVIGFILIGIGTTLFAIKEIR